VRQVPVEKADTYCAVKGIVGLGQDRVLGMAFAPVRKPERSLYRVPLLAGEDQHSGVGDEP